MAKVKQKTTRITKANREWLQREALTQIKDKPDEHKAFVAAAKLVDKEIRRCLKKTVPLSDMKILAKYNYGYQTNEEIYVTLAVVPGKYQFPRQSAYHMGGYRGAYAPYKNEWMLFKPEPLVLPKRDHRIVLDEQATAAFDDWADKVASREQRLQDLKEALNDLIWNAPNLEMIEEVWPGAIQLRALLPPPATLPAVIALNAMDKVREALLARQL